MMDKKVSKAKKLAKDDRIISWFDTIDAKENTQRNYTLAMQYYTEFTKKSPAALLKEAQTEIKAGLLPSERSIKNYLVKFRKSLQDRGLAPNTVKINMNGVCSFYAANEIDLPRIPKLKERTAPLIENLDIPEIEDLREALKKCDHIEKAIVLVGVASGLSMWEIRHLRIHHFKKGYDPQTEITTIKLRREKEQVDFITFLTPEASRAVREYLAYRGRESKTSRKSALAKQAIKDDNGYLFIKKHVPDSYLKNHNEDERQIEHDTFLLIYRTISDKMMKNSEKGHLNLIRSHNMRRYFYSKLRDAGCEHASIEYWMGHTIDKTTQGYFRPDPVYQKEIYKKYMSVLTIQPEPDEVVLAKYQDQVKQNEDLVQKNKELEADAVQLAIQKTELQKMEEEFENMKRRFTNLTAYRPGVLTKEKLDQALRDE
jgi:integrase